MQVKSNAPVESTRENRPRPQGAFPGKAPWGRGCVRTDEKRYLQLDDGFTQCRQYTFHLVRNFQDRA